MGSMRKTERGERGECFVSEHTKPSRSPSEREAEIETEREMERNRQRKRERTQGR